MVRVSSPAKLRPWSELTAKMVMGVVPGLVISGWTTLGRGKQTKNGFGLSGPLHRLNAILSLLHPLDRYRTSSAIGSAIGRPLSRIQAQVGVLNRLVLNRLAGSTASDSGAIVSKTPLKQTRNENAIEAAILNHVLDRD